MGLLRLPRINDYWSRSKILSTPWFPSIMSRDRFHNILRYLHLNDSLQQKRHREEGHDHLYKVRPLIGHLRAVLSLYYQPAQQVSIDEMMIGTRCRVPFLQYLPKKPTRFGIKVWVLAEAKTGYTLDFQVYTGKQGKDSTSTGDKGLDWRVVMDLMQQYQGKNHLLHVDNFYTSPDLVIDLLQRGIYCTGTVCTNRKHFPKDLIPPTKSMEMGSYRFAMSTEHDITAVWWKDRCDVYLLSIVCIKMPSKQ